MLTKAGSRTKVIQQTRLFQIESLPSASREMPPQLKTRINRKTHAPNLLYKSPKPYRIPRRSLGAQKYALEGESLVALPLGGVGGRSSLTDCREHDTGFRVHIGLGFRVYRASAAVPC